MLLYSLPYCQTKEGSMYFSKFLLVAATVCGVAVVPTSARADSATLTVKTVKGGGTVTIDFATTDQNGGNFDKTVKKVSVDSNDTPAAVAANIAKAFGTDLTASGDTVTFTNTADKLGFF